MSDLINAKIKYFSSTGRPQHDFVQKEIQSFLNSELYELRNKSLQYSKNKTIIQDKQRYKFAKNPNSIDANRPNGTVAFSNSQNEPELQKSIDTNAPNARLEHAFYRKLIQQKINYILGSPFSLNSSNLDYLKIVNNLLDKNFRQTVKLLARDSVINGIAHAYVTPENDKLKLTRIAPINTICYWRDDNNTILDGFIRFWEEEVYKETKIETITKVEFYTKEGIYYYVMQKGEIMYDETQKINPLPYLRIIDNENTIFGNWEQIPILSLKSNTDEVLLFDIIATLVDDYNKKVSNLSDYIDELGSPITVVKNYSGESRSNFIQRIAETKVAFVQDSGDLTKIPPNTDSVTINDYLTRLRKNIFELGGGIDLQNVQLSNTSGVALKFIFADLDIDCQELIGQLQNFINQLKWFIDNLLKNTTGKDYTNETLEITFNLNLIINESEAIDNILKSQNLLPMRDLLNQHPWVTDVAETEKLINEERQQNIDKYLQEPAQEELIIEDNE